MSAESDFYFSASLRHFKLPDATLSLRQYGKGPALLLVHGFPLYGFTWRYLLPTLAKTFTCYVPDLAGKGGSDWDSNTDFTFPAHAARLKQLMEQLGVSRYAVMAQDTGATIARCLALMDSSRVSKLVLFNTEIPHHRPPWIPLFQLLTRLPGAQAGFRALMSSRLYRRSSMGLGGCFTNPDLLDGEFHQYMIRPLLESSRRLEGVMRYLRGITWPVVDAMAEDHRKIVVPVLLVWGEEDPTFPIEHAQPMVRQFADCRGLVVIPQTRLLLHEEKSSEVLENTLPFLQQA